MSTNQEKPNQLPPKENALFKKIVKCYETKMFKNGLRHAKQILGHPKFAEHGETLAMKGLLLNSMGRREEATEHILRGLRNDVKSHVCWHVYGLLQRSEKKYDGAIKAYVNALKLDKDNIQILRDLSLLQIQMRDLEGYKETRYRLFDLRPSQRATWIGYAMAHHLLKDYDMAIRILEEFQNAQTNKTFDFEYSELLLYQNMLYREAEEYQKALDHLVANKAHILDKLAVSEIEADLCRKLNQRIQAASIFMQLIDRNSENRVYYESLESCLNEKGNSDYQLTERLSRYTMFCGKHSRANAPKRLPLNFTTGAKFKELLIKYLKPALRKGVPPLFLDIKPLYADPGKAQIIDEVMSEMLESLSTKETFHDCEEEESPTVILWLYFYLAQHFDHKGDHAKALHYIDVAIGHTPTLIELYMVKAKIYKHAGNPEMAVHNLNEAQSLDTADRYVNSKCAKYMLRAGLVDEAEKMCAKFTREGIPAVENLNEMQCMWFQTECAESYRRKGELGEALKKCHEVDRHFTEIIEDQFDFHTYCIRKMTLVAYVRLLRLEDTLRQHPFYFKAARCAIKIYLYLHDHPAHSDSSADGDANSSLSTGEAKKLQRKKEKAAKLAKQRAEQEKKEAEKAKSRQQHQNAQKDAADAEDAGLNQEQLDPEKLLNVETPIEEAAKFFRPLLQLKCDEVQGYVLGFEIYFRKCKVLLMLQCLENAVRLDAANPQVHLCKIKFLKFISRGSFHETVQELVDEGVANIYGSTTNPFELNKAFLASHSKSFPHVLAVAQSMYFLDESQSEAAVRMVTDCDDCLAGKDWKNCHIAFKILSRGSLGPAGSAPELLEKFRCRCKASFPLARVFLTAEERAENPDQPITAVLDNLRLLLNKQEGVDVCSGDSGAEWTGCDETEINNPPVPLPTADLNHSAHGLDLSSPVSMEPDAKKIDKYSVDAGLLAPGGEKFNEKNDCGHQVQELEGKVDKLVIDSAAGNPVV